MSKTEEQLTQEQLDQQAEQEFAAGFDGKDIARTEPEAPAPAAAPEKPEVETPAAETPAKEPEAAPAAEPTPEPTIAGLTESQVRDLLSKASEVDKLREEIHKVRDTAAGKYGELNRTLQTLQQAPGTPGAKLSKDRFKKVAELNEDFAEALAEDMSGIGGGIDDEQFNQRVQAKVDEVERKIVMDMEKRNLLRQHKDFYDQLETPEFKLWFNQQKEEDRKEWDSSIDSDYLGGRMTEFKAWRAGLGKRNTNQRRLEEAVQPKGAAPVSGGLTDEQAFEAGFYGK